MKYFIGIDLGGTNVRTLLVDENGQSYSCLLYTSPSPRDRG